MSMGKAMPPEGDAGHEVSSSVHKEISGNSKLLFGYDLHEWLRAVNQIDNMVMIRLKQGGNAGLPY